jgi:hypothetical protein
MPDCGAVPLPHDRFGRPVMTNALTPLDIDLLRAAFEPQPDAATAWRRWRNSVDWDGPIEPDAFPLLPRICRNLQAIGIDDPLFPRFKGIARQAWVNNQHLKATIGGWVTAIPSVEFMALPPTALLYADSTSLANQGRWFHFAVRPMRAACAIRGLLRAGWRASGLRLPTSLIEGYVLGTGHIPLELADTGTMTLTWRLETLFEDRVDEVWNDSESLAWGDHSMRSLCPTDAVTFSLRQRVGNHPVRWMSSVLSLASPMIDWPRVLRSLAMRPLSHECSELLPTLVRFLEGEHASASSWRWPVGPSDLVPVTRPREPSWNRWQKDWATYRAAWGSEYRLSTALIQLPGYLMGRWQLPSPGGLLQGLARWL